MTYHYEYEVREINGGDFELTVTWFDKDNKEIISGTKLIKSDANAEAMAAAFANDLKENNIELFEDDFPDEPDIPDEVVEEPAEEVDE